MTLRARPVARRRGRAGWDPGDRRNSLINLGFFLAIGLSTLILVGYAAWSWYDDHFGAAATVNGHVITKDDLRSRITIESFRLDYIESRIRTLIARGRVAQADGQQQIDIITQRRGQLTSLTLDRLVDVELMAELAPKNGVEVTDADIDAELVSEATTSEERHVWMIEVEPATDPDTGQVTDEGKRTALGRAQRALARLKNGESWDVVAKTASDSAIAPQAGDLGFLSKDSGYDEAFMNAVFAANINDPTGVVEGADGTFRIGRFTETAPAEVDANLQASVEAAGIKMADYRAAARGDIVRKKLSDKIVVDMSLPGLQRHVLEIYLPDPNPSTVGPEPGVKIRQIVFAPNDDTSKAKDLPAEDPAWAKAKADADAAYAELKLHPERFDEMARTLSDEALVKGSGGKEPWYYQSSTIDQAIKDAIFAPDLQSGQLLPPVKSAFAWSVIQFMRPTGDGEDKYLESLKAKVTDDASFEQLAKDNSEAPEADKGGDLGWIAKGQLADEVDAAVFATAIGSMSDVVTIANDGYYLVRILAEETRTPTDDQLKIFKDNGFSYWYTREKAAAKIDYAIGTQAGTG
jgi:parvulin-like peptidyl-prolyl isomerase